MNIYFKYSAVGILSCLCLISQVDSVKAEEHYSASKYLIQLGEELIDKGDLEGGLHEFSKALLIEPQNKKALAYLEKYGLMSGMYSGHATHGQQKAALASHLETYQNQIQQLQKEKNDLIKRFDSLVTTNHRLSKQNDNLTRALERSASSRVGNINNSVMDSSAPFLNVSSQEQSRKNYLPHSIYGKYQQALDYAVNSDYKIHQLEQTYSSLRLSAEDEYRYQDKLIHVLEDYLRLRERSMEDYKDAWVINNIELARLEFQMGDTLSDLEQQYDSKTKYLETMDWQNQKIDEKNDDILSLTSRVNSYNHVLEEKNRIIHAQQSYIAEFESEFDQIRREYETLIESVE